MSEPPNDKYEPFPGATRLVLRAFGVLIGLIGGWILFQATGPHVVLGVFLMMYSNNLFND